MFTNKKILYFAGVVIVLGLLVFSFLLANNRSSNTASPTIVVPAKNGAVPVNNVTQNPVQQVGDTVVFAQTDQYSIIYYQKEQTFSITISSQPAQPARDAAEAVLLQKLGISKDQSCNLIVTTYVPYDVDPNLSGQDYGLSFCPSGKAF